MKRRLAPMPTDTRLARFVDRLVDRVKRHSPVAWSNTVRNREQQITRQRWEISEYRLTILNLERDFNRLISRDYPILPPIIETTVEDDVVSQRRRWTVDFGRVHYQAGFAEIQLSRHGDELLNRIAHSMARHQTDKLAGVILRHFTNIESKKRA